MIFEMGAKLEDEVYETSKTDKKVKKNNIKNKTNTNSKFNKDEILPKNQHQLVFTFEKRKGKPVTLLGRFSLSDNDKKDVLKLLKKKLACGGAIKDEWIELQGNVKEKVISILEKEEWKFRK